MQMVCAELAHVSARVLIHVALPSDLRLPELGRADAEKCSPITTYQDQAAVRVLVKNFVRITP